MEGNTILSGEVINKIFIYSNGEVLAELEEVQDHEVRNNILSSIYDGVPTSITLESGVVKAIKLNLNRKDNFFIRNSEARYSFDKPYNLYINVSEVVFNDKGDMLAAEHDHEKCYLHAYEVTFKNATFKRCIVERELCDNYTLQNNEVFSSCYGRNKENACIEYFDHTTSELVKRFHPEKANEKGIIRKYFKYESVDNCKMLLAKRCYTKIVYDDYRLNAQKIAEAFTNAGVKVSYYDIERLLQSGIKIEL